MIVALNLALLCASLWTSPRLGQADGPLPAPRSHGLKKGGIAAGDVPLQRPRFIDNKDGTVTDTRSGLIWLRHANCVGGRTWNEAMRSASELHDGTRCEDMVLQDGSRPGDWRLPSIREIMTLPVMEYFNPALPNAMGTGRWSEGDLFFQASTQYFWSSTRLENDTAWYMYLYNGSLGLSDINQRYAVWPVKGRLDGLWDLGS